MPPSEAQQERLRQIRERAAQIEQDATNSLINKLGQVGISVVSGVATGAIAGAAGVTGKLIFGPAVSSGVGLAGLGVLVGAEGEVKSSLAELKALEAEKNAILNTVPEVTVEGSPVITLPEVTVEGSPVIDVPTTIILGGAEGGGEGGPQGGGEGGPQGGGEGGPQGGGEGGAEGGGEGGAEGGGEGGGCFVSDTPVLMADGKIKTIDAITVGDQVMARDEKTGHAGIGVVSEIFRHFVTDTLLLQLGEGEIIETTAAHRFAVDGGGFVSAGELIRGAKLSTHSAKGAEVVETRARKVEATVYNLSIERFHTFFVGDAELWVHNLKKSDPPDPETDR